MTAPAPLPPRDIAALDVPLDDLVAELRRLHDGLPAASTERHLLEDPAIEAAFARLAMDHPDRCTPAGDWAPGGAR